MAKRRASCPPRDVRLDYFHPCAVHKGGFIFMLAPNFRGIAIILGVPERLTNMPMTPGLTDCSAHGGESS
jgi:hypothetical protein